MFLQDENPLTSLLLLFCLHPTTCQRNRSRIQCDYEATMNLLVLILTFRIEHEERKREK